MPFINPALPTLYHAKRACSMVARLCAAFGKVDVNLVHVDLTTKQMHYENALLAQSFYDINPLGQVSVLRFPRKEPTAKPHSLTETPDFSGSPDLTETIAIALWFQFHSRDPAFKRTPDHPDYFQMIRWMSFCSTQIHQQIFRIVFYDEATDSVKNKIRALAPARFETLDARLENRDFLVGDYFSAADAYLIWVLCLAERAGLDPKPFKNLMVYQQKIMALPLVKKIIDDDLTPL